MSIYVRDKQGELKVLDIPAYKGKDGITPNLTVGEVTTLPSGSDATVTIRGDKEAPILDFGLPSPGGVEKLDKIDYMGNTHTTLKETNDANVEYVLGEVNTVHYEGQHITATDTIEKQVKSAILKGQTLVNLLGNYPEQTFTLDNTWQQRNIPIEYTNLIKPNTTYTFVFNVTECQMADSTKSNLQIGDDHVFNNMVNLNLKLGVNTYKLTTKDSITFPLKLYGSAYNSGTLTFNLMLLEGDYVGQNIPHFNGMQSVKMPVLTATGKNLFDVSKLEGLHENIEMIPNGIRVKNMQIDITRCFANPFKENTQYTFSFNHTQIEGEGREGFRFYYTDGTNSYAIPQSNSSFVGSSSANKTIKSISLSFNNEGKSELTNIQLEEGSTATSYEPFKTNILTVNEDVTLRGVGNVKDELDCLTGEVTERIGEIVLDGSEGWSNYISSENSIAFISQTFNNTINKQHDSTNLICDKLTVSGYGAWSKDYNISLNTRSFSICLPKTVVSDLNSFKQWLSQNPITVQYELESHIVKTVDLKGQKVYSYKDTTHYDCSSAEGSLVPILSIDVPTHLSALVNDQRQMIQSLEAENQILKDEIQLVGLTQKEASAHLKEGILSVSAAQQTADLEILAQSFDTDFRLMQIEMAISSTPSFLPLSLKTNSFIMTSYEMAKRLILAKNYEIEDMKQKLDVYLKNQRITKANHDELMNLMGQDRLENSEEEVKGTPTILPI